ncbi:hypothetical protein K469DRAFT_569877, partial [Zopfia rhizophila CBS 207.26]
YKKRLYIPNIDKLKAKLLYFYHKSSITSYIDYNKIYKLLFCKYYWFYMYNFITY